MSQMQVDNLDDIRISGFDLAITLSDGTVELIPDGVMELLKGDLTFVFASGAVISRQEILGNVNLPKLASLPLSAMPGANQSARGSDETISEVPQETEVAREAVRHRIAELKKIKEQLAQTEKEGQEEPEGKHETEPDKQAVPESQLVEELIQQLNQNLITDTPETPLVLLADTSPATSDQIDTTGPTLGAVSLQSGSDTDSSGFITSDTCPVFSGSGSQGDTITIAIYRGDVLITTGSTLVTSEDGTWNVQINNLSDGHYHWIITARDTAGNQSRLDTPEQTLTIDTLYTGSLVEHLASDGTPTCAGTDEAIALDDEVILDNEVIIGGANGAFTLDSTAPATTTALANGTGRDADSTITKNNQLLIHTQLSGNVHSAQLLVWRAGESALSPTFNQTFTLDSSTTEHTFTTTALPDGNYQYKVIIMDMAGNISESATRHVTVNTIPPELGDVIQEGTRNGTYVNNASVSFTGTAEPDACIYVVLTKGSETIAVKPTHVAADAAGHWRYTLQPLVASTLQDGIYHWSFLAVDRAGNISSARNGQFTLDTRKPEVTFTGLASEDDSGELGAGLLTNAERPVFCGTVNENALVTITLSSPGKTYTFTTVGSVNGNWELAATQDLQEGSYTISLSATDLAGNLGNTVEHDTSLEIDRTITGGDVGNTKSVEGSFILDSRMDLTARFDSQTNSADAEVYSNNTTPVLSGTGNADDQITVVLSGPDGQQTLNTTVTAAGTWTVTADALSSDGVYNWSATAVDGSGNTQDCVSDAFTLNTSVPILTVDEISGEGYQLINDDVYVRDASVTLSGRLDADTKIQGVTLNGTAIAHSVLLSGGGVWSLEIDDLPEGNNTIVINTQNEAGNIGSETLVINRNSMIAGADSNNDDCQNTVTNLTAGLVDAGIDGIVTEAPLFTGTVEPGATVTVMITGNGDQIISLNASVDALGNWTADATGLPDGNYSWSVVATDTAGNSNDMVGTGFTLDTKITGFTSTLMDVGADGRVNANPCFAGTVEPGSTVTVTLSPASAEAREIHLTAVVADNKWTTSATDLPDGEYLWNVTATDAAGNSFTTEPTSFTLHTSTTATWFALDADLSANLVSSSTDGIVTDAPAFIGTVEPGSAVTVMITGAGDQIITLDATVDADKWAANAADLPRPLPDGEYSWSVTATDAEGNSTETTGASFTLASARAELTGALMDATVDGTITDVPVFSGVADPGADVLVELVHQDTGETVTLRAISDANGHWGSTGDGLGDGRYSWSLSATDTAGNSSTAPGGEFAFSATNIAPPSPILTLVSDTPDQPLLETRVFAGESSIDATVTLTIAGKIYETTADDEGDWMIKAEFDRSGIFNYQLQYRNVHGEPVTEQGITNVRMVSFDSLDSSHNARPTGSSAAIG